MIWRGRRCSRNAEGGSIRGEGQEKQVSQRRVCDGGHGGAATPDPHPRENLLRDGVVCGPSQQRPWSPMQEPHSWELWHLWMVSCRKVP